MATILRLAISGKERLCLWSWLWSDCPACVSLGLYMRNRTLQLAAERCDRFLARLASASRLAFSSLDAYLRGRPGLRSTCMACIHFCGWQRCTRGDIISSYSTSYYLRRIKLKSHHIPVPRRALCSPEIKRPGEVAISRLGKNARREFKRSKRGRETQKR